MAHAILPRGSKGQIDRNVVTGVAVILITIAVVVFAVDTILTGLNAESNSMTENTIENIKYYMPTIVKLLIVVAIVIVIGVILRAIGVF